MQVSYTEVKKRKTTKKRRGKNKLCQNGRSSQAHKHSQSIGLKPQQRLYKKKKKIYEHRYTWYKAYLETLNEI